MSDVIKICGCGRTFTVDQWRELVGCGRMLDEEGDLDLRHCPCGSTLAVLVSDLQEDERLAFELKRIERIERLVAGAERAVDFALSFAAEDRDQGRAVFDDHRVISATRQANQYLAAVQKERAMRFDCNDLVLVALVNEELAAAE